MKEKRIIALLLLSLFLISVVVVGLNTVSAQTSYDVCRNNCNEAFQNARDATTDPAVIQTAADTRSSCLADCNQYALNKDQLNEKLGTGGSEEIKLPSWIKNNSLFQIFTGKDLNASGEFAKLLILLLLIVLIYSALETVQFPENKAIRLVLAIVVGVLATMLITTAEILSLLQSYKALGIAITVFFPIMILTFFTFVVSTKGNPFGILTQKILWIAYSVYLFLRAGILILLKWALAGGGVDKQGFLIKFVEFLGGKSLAIGALSQYDTTTLIVNVAIAIAVFFIFVVGNDALALWLASEKRDIDIENQKDRLKRSQALRKAEADATRE